MKINSIVLTIAVVATLASCNSKKETSEHNHENGSQSAATQQDTVKKSIPKEVHAQVGKAHITMTYHAPAVRGRTIWGGLVPYGDVWVTGAHKATTFEINKDFIVGPKEIPAGKYALFTIPDRDKWTIIFNKNWDQHLTDEYNQQDDVVRIEVAPNQSENIQERLKYTIAAQNENTGNIDFRWEKIHVLIPFKIK